ncbi:MAG: biotin--[acetyl-CoA-carboxylase] ligase [Bradymonadaceae bacterium]|nr:biotin--[acetyl-CoA-carboxylase] ligase [Lujinxingiaceae bacterium]
MSALPAIALYDSVESTNDLALAAVGGDAGHGACWVADRQLAGRGRRELGGQRRAWHSPGGQNIYMSVLLRPSIDVSRAAGLTLASGVGVCQVLREMTGVDIWLKWPNDLFVGNRKLGGLLTEAATSGAQLSAVVVGLGINVNLGAEDVPDELRAIMTTLAIEAKERFDRLAMLAALRAAIVERCDAFCEAGYPAIAQALGEFDRSDGRAVSLVQEGKTLAGTARGIGADGQLLVELEGGALIEVSAGEVRFL